MSIFDRPEGYYHTRLEPPEPPPWCDRCGTYHADGLCPEDADLEPTWKLYHWQSGTLFHAQADGDDEFFTSTDLPDALEQAGYDPAEHVLVEGQPPADGPPIEWPIPAGTIFDIRVVNTAEIAQRPLSPQTVDRIARGARKILGLDLRNEGEE